MTIFLNHTSQTLKGTLLSGALGDFNNDGYIDIDDVAFLQNLGIAWNAMADHVIHGSADGFGEAVVIQRGGNGLLDVDNVVVAKAVQLAGADAGLYMGANHFEHIRREASGHAHSCNFVRRLDADCHNSGRGLVELSAGRFRVDLL